MILRLWSPAVARAPCLGAPIVARARHLCCAVQESGKHRIVFLGTPEVAASVLKELLQASQAANSRFEVAAVVSQPGRPKGRGNRATPVPSPVEQLARESGLADEHILLPASAKEESFLGALDALQPDLCVTAAYGNMLPKRFLALPRLGTLNVHPSLLPKYRGAAPVPRALQDGVVETGVSLAYTVRRCDAGPVLAQRTLRPGPDVQAPELLELLFQMGAQLLLEKLDDVWDGRAAQQAWEQDEAQASHAAKMSKEEARVDLRRPASEVHDAVRAFAGWPGSLASFSLGDEQGAVQAEVVELKLLRTRVPSADELPGDVLAALLGPSRGRAVFRDGRMFLPCGALAAGGGAPSVLEVLQLQPPGRRATAARDFHNGLGGKQLLIPVDPAQT